MRRALWCALLAFLVTVPAMLTAQGTLVRGPLLSACEDVSKVASVNINTSSSGNYQMVAISGTTRIYPCGIKLNVAGAVVIQLIYGTGTACATGETDVDTWEFTEATTQTWGIANTGAIQWQRTPTGQAMCLELSTGVAVTGSFTYVQQ